MCLFLVHFLPVLPILPLLPLALHAQLQCVADEDGHGHRTDTSGNGGHVSISYSAAGASDSFFLASPFFPAPFFAAGFSSFPFFSSASGLSAPFLAGFGAILLTAGKKLSHYMYLAAKCS
eukprot:GHVU01232438.1.p2 GENE.GHVU01232438.1~~GHVU01232438.1.p2  ORF type:complete len:120 (-),score=2.49 GHVU01232438.1:826-1185(-)